jgi:hypothetical protein
VKAGMNRKARIPIVSVIERAAEMAWRHLLFHMLLLEIIAVKTKLAKNTPHVQGCTRKIASGIRHWRTKTIPFHARLIKRKERKNIQSANAAQFAWIPA